VDLLQLHGDAIGALQEYVRFASRWRTCVRRGRFVPQILGCCCAACFAGACLATDSHTVTNCTLYTDKICTPCRVCTSTEFMISDCQEHSNRVCKGAAYA
jgi:hypothetical protein